MNFDMYPFDSHNCSFQVGSCKLTLHCSALAWNDFNGHFKKIFTTTIRWPAVPTSATPPLRAGVSSTPSPGGISGRRGRWSPWHRVSRVFWKPWNYYFFYTWSFLLLRTLCSLWFWNWTKEETWALGFPGSTFFVYWAKLDLGKPSKKHLHILRHIVSISLTPPYITLNWDNIQLRYFIENLPLPPPTAIKIKKLNIIFSKDDVKHNVRL